MTLSRGLAALILTTLFFSTLEAKYLHKDDVVVNSDWAYKIESIGEELYETTGVSLYLIMNRELENNQSIIDYEKEVISKLDEPAVLVTFIEIDQKIDIFARPASLYEDFNKKQVLSPNAGISGAIVSALMFARSYDEFKEFLTTSGGTILPILANKAKAKDLTSKYSVAMFNGYSDVAEQIALSNGVELKSAAGNANKDTLLFFKLIFYGILLYGIIRYIIIKVKKKRES
ncbi:MAG: 3-dehydroquinate dehydratase [Campylobacterota bacterium]|nr:3-dehydroquinate dehydratase [Campylobacterota bacterium]